MLFSVIFIIQTKISKNTFLFHFPILTFRRSRRQSRCLLFHFRRQSRRKGWISGAIFMCRLGWSWRRRKETRSGGKRGRSQIRISRRGRIRWFTRSWIRWHGIWYRYSCCCCLERKGEDVNKQT